jgi:uncharacterized membrane protein YoaK (UPF0700 family)
MKLNLPIVLSFNGGYVDTVGFLALQGLFTAHVTGNFVTIGAAIAHGSSGIIAKLLALPVFCVAVIVLRFAMLHLPTPPRRSVLSMLCVKSLFLTAGAACAILFRSFADPDGWQSILTGMLLVIAMAVQNAVHRIHLGSAPPSTLMTGTTTQIMIDVADILYGAPTKAPEAVRTRLQRLIIAVATFALGCGVAALFYIELQMWCFVIPPLVALAGIAIHLRDKETT